jgi:hypothetical protein
MRSTGEPQFGHFLAIRGKFLAKKAFDLMQPIRVPVFLAHHRACAPTRRLEVWTHLGEAVRRGELELGAQRNQAGTRLAAIVSNITRS